LTDFWVILYNFGSHELKTHKQETIAIKHKNLSEALQLQLFTENINLLGENAVL